MKKLLLIAGCFLLLAATISGVWATMATNRQQPAQVLEVDGTDWASGPALQYLTQQSELIVTGRCLATISTWRDRELFTVATVEVSTTIKGAPASTLTVNFLGGVDLKRRVPIEMSYPGAPKIRRGEEVLLFLTPDRRSHSYTVTGFDGKLSIITDSQGQKMVSRDLTRAPLQSGTGVTRGSLRTVSLAEFEGQIRKYLQ